MGSRKSRKSRKSKKEVVKLSEEDVKKTLAEVEALMTLCRYEAYEKLEDLKQSNPEATLTDAMLTYQEDVQAVLHELSDFRRVKADPATITFKAPIRPGIEATSCILLQKSTKGMGTFMVALNAVPLPCSIDA